MARSLFLACALALVGCSEEMLPPAPDALETAMTFSYTGSPEAFDVSTRAADEWNRVCGVSLVVTQDVGHVPLRAVPGPIYTKTGQLSVGLTARTLDGHVESIVFQDDPDKRHGNVLHELGHALGLQHTTAATGVMAAHWNKDMVVRPEDCP